MILDFFIVQIGPEAFAVTAVMLDEPARPVGIFCDEEEVEEACRQFEREHVKSLH